ncbi:BTAD domain-containing putative transcriptional regulator [Actinoplanes missouriensis]|uniref:AfsR/SARP family transcriptional regulator n=1 Tax=Actinoplanes missouriensis TaxID=1866 RepID=UPI0033F06722
MRDGVHPREREQEATFQAYLFGPFRVFREAESLGQRSHRREKALMLLKWFLLNPGRLRSIDELIEMICPDTAPEKATASFHVAMHCLRRMLEPDLRRGEESSYILRSGTNFYRFEAGNRWWTDTGEVDWLFEQGRTSDDHGDARRACFYYGQLVAHPVRRFLEDDDSQTPWLVPYRRRYEGLHVQALLRLMQIHGERGETEEAAEYAYQMLMLDPYNERAAITVVESDLEHGRARHARRKLWRFVESCTRDLGISPSRDVLTLQDRVLRCPLPTGR